jgi:hypothetical protein
MQYLEHGEMFGSKLVVKLQFCSFFPTIPTRIYILQIKLLHVILNKSKLAYRIYVILIASKELKKKHLLKLGRCARLFPNITLRP